MEASERKVPRATHHGVLPIGDVEFDAYVLDDGRRVLSRRGMAKALFGPNSGGGDFARFTGSKGVKPYLSQHLLAVLNEPIEFWTNRGRSRALGVEATALQELCGGVVRAAIDGMLRADQIEAAKRAAVYSEAFARVGVVALVDEATGYQRDRREHELREILNAYIQVELRPYSARFPRSFFEHMCRLHGWESRDDMRTPRAAGQFISRHIYERLPVGVVEALRSINPADDHGRRRNKHADGDALQHLERQIQTVHALMSAADTREEFDRHMGRVFGPPRKPAPPDPANQVTIDWEAA